MLCSFVYFYYNKIFTLKIRTSFIEAVNVIVLYFHNVSKRRNDAFHYLQWHYDAEHLFQIIWHWLRVLLTVHDIYTYNTAPSMVMYVIKYIVFKHYVIVIPTRLYSENAMIM